MPFEPIDFLAQIVHWAIQVAPDDYTFRQSAELITAFVYKRSEALLRVGALENMLQKIWISDIQDTSKDGKERERALHVFLHVSLYHALSPIHVGRLYADG